MSNKNYYQKNIVVIYYLLNILYLIAISRKNHSLSITATQENTTKLRYEQSKTLHATVSFGDILRNNANRILY